MKIIPVNVQSLAIRNQRVIQILPVVFTFVQNSRKQAGKGIIAVNIVALTLMKIIEDSEIAVNIAGLNERLGNISQRGIIECLKHVYPNMVRSLSPVRRAGVIDEPCRREIGEGFGIKFIDLNIGFFKILNALSIVARDLGDEAAVEKIEQFIFRAVCTFILKTFICFLKTVGGNQRVDLRLADKGNSFRGTGAEES